MFEDQDGELFQGSRGDMAAAHAQSVHDAIRVFRGWSAFLDQVPDDTDKDQEKIDDTIEAVETAVEMMEDLYPQLAVHAALLRIREEEQASTSLDPSDDHAFL